MGNRLTLDVIRIGTYELMFDDSFRVDLDNCCYSIEITRTIISFHSLFRQGYHYVFDKNDGTILFYRKNVFVFKAYPCNNVYEAIVCVCVNETRNNVISIDYSSGLDKAYLWHCRLSILTRNATPNSKRKECLNDLTKFS